MKPFEEGKRAFRTGKDLSNPYAENTVRHREWQYGFDRAYFDNVQRIAPDYYQSQFKDKEKPRYAPKSQTVLSLA